MQNYKISASLLAANFAELGNDIKRVSDAEVDYIHIDIMDGHFVPATSMGVPVIKSIRPYTDKAFDVHLMMQKPEEHLLAFKEAGADIITVHAEGNIHLYRTLQQIKDMGLKAGVALNPGTPLSALDCVYEEADMILLLMVNPGFGGQSLIPSMITKLSVLRENIERRNLDIDIEVDGGINPDTIRMVRDAGANVFVAGTAIFNSNPTKSIQKIREALNCRESN